MQLSQGACLISSSKSENFKADYHSEPAVDPPSCNPDASLNPAERLKWNIEKSVIDPYIKAAQATALSLIKDTESVTLHQKIYGSRYIKEVGMDIQLIFV